ncbi:MAG: hypothetical protein FWE22_01415 [Firmicutes bacterium]|nr:hypothetical protein [Bacillota bacterium]
MFKRTKTEDGVIEFQSVKQSRFKMLILVSLVGVFVATSILFAILFATAGGMQVGVNRISFSHSMLQYDGRYTASIGARYTMDITLEIVGEEISPSLEFDVHGPQGFENIIIFGEEPLYRRNREQFALSFTVSSDSRLHDERIDIVFTSAGRQETFSFYAVFRHAVTASLATHIQGVGNQSNFLISNNQVNLPLSADVSRRTFALDVTQLAIGGASVSSGERLDGHDLYIEDFRIEVSGGNIVNATAVRGERVYLALVGVGNATIEIIVNAFNTSENIILTLNLTVEANNNMLEDLWFTSPYFALFLRDSAASAIYFGRTMSSNPSDWNVGFFPQISNPQWELVEVISMTNFNTPLNPRVTIDNVQRTVMSRQVGVTFLQLRDTSPNGFGVVSQPVEFRIMYDTNSVSVSTRGISEFAQGQSETLNVELGITLVADMGFGESLPHQVIRQSIIFRYLDERNEPYFNDDTQTFSFSPASNHHTIVFRNMVHYREVEIDGNYVNFFKITAIENFRTRSESVVRHFGYGSIVMYVGSDALGMDIQFYSARQRSIINEDAFPGGEQNPTPSGGGSYYVAANTGNPLTIGVRSAVARIGFVPSFQDGNIQFFHSPSLNSQVLILPAVSEGVVSGSGIEIRDLLRFLDIVGGEISQYMNDRLIPQNVQVRIQQQGSGFHLPIYDLVDFVIPNNVCGTRLLVELQVVGSSLNETVSFLIVFADMVNIAELTHEISVARGGDFDRSHVGNSQHFVSFGNVQIPNFDGQIFTNIIAGTRMLFSWQIEPGQVGFFLNENDNDANAVFRLDVQNSQLFMLRDLMEIYVDHGINLLNFDIVFSIFPIIPTAGTSNNWTFDNSWARNYLFENLGLTPAQISTHHLIRRTVSTRRLFDSIGLFNAAFTTPVAFDGVAHQRLTISDNSDYNNIAFHPSGVFRFSDYGQFVRNHVLGHQTFEANLNRESIAVNPRDVIYEPTNNPYVAFNHTISPLDIRSFNISRQPSAERYFGYTTETFHFRHGEFEVPFIVRVYSRVLEINSIELFFTGQTETSSIIVEGNRFSPDFLIPFVLGGDNTSFSILARVTYVYSSSTNFLRRERLSLSGVSDNIYLYVVGFRGEFIPSDSGTGGVGSSEVFRLIITNNHSQHAQFENVNVVSAGNPSIRNQHNFQIDVARKAEAFNFTELGGAGTVSTITVDMTSYGHNENILTSGSLQQGTQMRFINVGQNTDMSSRGSIDRLRFEVFLGGNRTTGTDFFGLNDINRPFGIDFDSQGNLIVRSTGQAGEWTIHVYMFESQFARRESIGQMTLGHVDFVEELAFRRTEINIVIRADLANVRIVSRSGNVYGPSNNHLTWINLHTTGAVGRDNDTHFEIGVIKNLNLAMPTLGVFNNFRVEVSRNRDGIITAIPGARIYPSAENPRSILVENDMTIPVTLEDENHHGYLVVLWEHATGVTRRTIPIQLHQRAVDSFGFIASALDQFQENIPNQPGAYNLIRDVVTGNIPFGFNINNSIFEPDVITNITYSTPGLATVTTIATPSNLINISIIGTTEYGIPLDIFIRGRVPTNIAGEFADRNHGAAGAHVTINLNICPTDDPLNATPFTFSVNPDDPIDFIMTITIVPINMAGIASGTERTLQLSVSSNDRVNNILSLAAIPGQINSLVGEEHIQLPLELTLVRGFALNLSRFIRFTTPARTEPFVITGLFDLPNIETNNRVTRIEYTNTLTMDIADASVRTRITIRVGTVVRYIDILIVEPTVIPTFGSSPVAGNPFIRTTATDTQYALNTPYINFNVTPHNNIYVRFVVGNIGVPNSFDTFSLTDNTPRLEITPDDGGAENFIIATPVINHLDLPGEFVFRLTFIPQSGLNPFIYNNSNRFFHMSLSVVISGQRIVVGEPSMLRLVVEPSIGDIHHGTTAHHYHGHLGTPPNNPNGTPVTDQPTRPTISVQGTSYFRISLNSLTNSTLIGILGNDALRGQVEVEFTANLPQGLNTNIIVNRIHTHAHYLYSIFRVTWPSDVGASNVNLIFSLRVSIFGVNFGTREVLSVYLHNTANMPTYFDLINISQDFGGGDTIEMNRPLLSLTDGRDELIGDAPRQNVLAIIDFSETGFVFTNAHLRSLNFFISHPILSFDLTWGRCAVCPLCLSLEPNTTCDEYLSSIARISSNRIYAILTIDYSLFTPINTSFSVSFWAQIIHNNMLYASMPATVRLLVDPPNIQVYSDETGLTGNPTFNLTPPLYNGNINDYIEVPFSIVSGIGNVGVSINRIGSYNLTDNDEIYFRRGDNPIFRIDVLPSLENFNIIVFIPRGANFGGEFVLTFVGTFDSGIFKGHSFSIDITIIIEEVSPPSIVAANANHEFRMGNTSHTILSSIITQATTNFVSTDFVDVNFGAYGAEGFEMVVNPTRSGITSVGGVITQGMLNFNNGGNIVFRPLRPGVFTITLSFDITQGFWQHITPEVTLVITVLAPQITARETVYSRYMSAEQIVLSATNVGLRLDENNARGFVMVNFEGGGNGLTTQASVVSILETGGGDTRGMLLTDYIANNFAGTISFVPLRVGFYEILLRVAVSINMAIYGDMDLFETILRIRISVQPPSITAVKNYVYAIPMSATPVIISPVGITALPSFANPFVNINFGAIGAGTGLTTTAGIEQIIQVGGNNDYINEMLVARDANIMFIPLTPGLFEISLRIAVTRNIGFPYGTVELLSTVLTIRISVQPPSITTVKNYVYDIPMSATPVIISPVGIIALPSFANPFININFGAIGAGVGLTTSASIEQITQIRGSGANTAEMLISRDANIMFIPLTPGLFEISIRITVTRNLGSPHGTAVLASSVLTMRIEVHPPQNISAREEAFVVENMGLVPITLSPSERDSTLPFNNDFISFNLGSGAGAGLVTRVNSSISETGGGNSNNMINTIGGYISFTPNRAGVFEISLTVVVSYNLVIAISVPLTITIIVLPRIEIEFVERNSLTLGQELTIAVSVIGSMNASDGAVNIENSDIAIANINSNFGTVSSISAISPQVVFSAALSLTTTRNSPAEITASIVLGGRFGGLDVDNSRLLDINNLELTGTPRNAANPNNSAPNASRDGQVLSVQSGTSFALNSTNFLLSGLSAPETITFVDAVIYDSLTQIDSNVRLVITRTNSLITITADLGLFADRPVIEATLVVLIRNGTHYFRNIFQIVMTGKPVPTPTVNASFAFIHGANPAITNGFRLHVGERLDFTFANLGGYQIENIALNTTNPNSIGISNVFSGSAITGFSITALSVPPSNINFISLYVTIHGRQWQVSMPLQNIQIFPSQAGENTEVTVSQNRNMTRANVGASSRTVDIVLTPSGASNFSHAVLNMSFTNSNRIESISVNGVAATAGTSVNVTILAGDFAAITIRIVTNNQSAANCYHINANIVLRYRFVVDGATAATRRLETTHSIHRAGTNFNSQISIASIGLSAQRGTGGQQNIVTVTPTARDINGDEIPNRITGIVLSNYSIVNYHGVVRTPGATAPRLSGINFLFNITDAARTSGVYMAIVTLTVEGIQGLVVFEGNNWDVQQATTVSLSSSHNAETSVITITPTVRDQVGAIMAIPAANPHPVEWTLLSSTNIVTATGFPAGNRPRRGTGAGVNNWLINANDTTFTAVVTVTVTINGVSVTNFIIINSETGSSWTSP